MSILSVTNKCKCFFLTFNERKVLGSWTFLTSVTSYMVGVKLKAELGAGMGVACRRHY